MKQNLIFALDWFTKHLRFLNLKENSVYSVPVAGLNCARLKSLCKKNSQTKFTKIAWFNHILIAQQLKNNCVIIIYI